MHPSAHLRDEVNELRAELDELKARLGVAPGATPATREPGLPAGAYRDPSGMLRNARGDLIQPDDAPSYLQRQAERAAAAKAEDASFWERATAGLPKGHYRDFSGIVRERDTGKTVSFADAEAIQREAVERQQRDDHRDWKQAQRLPVRDLPDQSTPISGEPT
jgi:hypothetical protein